MPAANFTDFRKNLKSYCDEIHDKDEVLVVSRKGERHLVVLSLEHYNRLEKAAQAAHSEGKKKCQTEQPEDKSDKSQDTQNKAETPQPLEAADQNNKEQQ